MIPLGILTQQILGGIVTLVSDLFTDTDTTELTNHTPDIDVEAGGWFDDGSNWEISGNKATCADASSSITRLAWIDVGETDVIVEADCHYDDAPYYLNSGLMFRYASATSYYMAGVVKTFTASPWQFGIFERVGGSNIEKIVQTGVSTSGSVTRHVKVTFYNQTIRLEIPDESVDITYRYSDTNPTSTKMGLRGSMQSGSGGRTMNYDNLTITTLDTTWLPTDLASCVLWLDANDRGVVSNQWDDKSGQDNHFVASIGSEFPTFASGIATFVATSQQHLDGPDFCSSYTEGEIFYLIKAANDPTSTIARSGWDTWGSSTVWDTFIYTNGDIYNGWGSTTRKTNFDSALGAMNQWRSHNIHSALNDWAYKIDTISQRTDASNTVGFTTVPVIGKSYDNGYLDADVKAILMFNEKLSDADRYNVEIYLNGL